MGNNWMWGVALAAAAGHALRWVPADATSRGVRIPATFAVLYVVYGAALALGELRGVLVALVAVELVLQLVRRRRAATSEGKPGDATARRRR